MKHVDVDAGDDLTLHCTVRGNGPPLIMLHGFTGSGETWESIFGRLAQAHEIITIDLPGHGRSSAPGDPARYSLDRFAGDLARVLDVLSYERVAVLGYSLGGRAALQFALSYGERVAALILESTSPGISDKAERANRIAADGELAAMIEREGVAAFVERWERLPLWDSQRGAPDSSRKRLRQQRLANRPGGLANSLRGAGAGAWIPVTDRLASVAAPTLVVAGALDEKYVALAKLLAASIPDAGLLIVPGAGHAVHFERPDALDSEVSAFLDRVPSSGSRWL